MKELLEKYGFSFVGICSTCDGKAERWMKGRVECKIKPMQMKFTLIINGRKIIGKSSELEGVLNQL